MSEWLEAFRAELEAKVSELAPGASVVVQQSAASPGTTSVAIELRKQLVTGSLQSSESETSPQQAGERTAESMSAVLLAILGSEP